jgi:enoyl-CoA hydratase/carnithine racemase
MGLIVTEQRGAVAILTLNNPEKYNALDGATLPELLTAFDFAASDSVVRAILLTGAGKGFCKGAQLGTLTFGLGASVGDMIRRSLNPLIVAPVAESIEREAAAQSEAFATNDLREGAAAFVEKQVPAFSGR